MTWTGQYDRLFIGGDWVEPEGTEKIEVISPSTEQVIAEVPAGSTADIDRAVIAARSAFDHGPWPLTPVEERILVLRRLAAAFDKNQRLLASLATEQMGCPISLSRSLQGTIPRLIIDTYAEIGESYPFSSLRRSATGTALVQREPVGVVAAIVPWNAPQMTMALKLAPALLAGCTVVLKTASETPLDAYLLAEMLQEAGLPAGVVNIVCAGRKVSEHLVTHPGVDKVTFTGSTAAGQRIAALCGHDLRRVTLELGGKSAAVILDDADMDLTIEAVERGSFRNAGQSCAAKTRLVVSRRRQDELLGRLADLIASMRVGDPFDPSTQVGPLATSRQRERVEAYIRAGKKEGARLLVGGGRPADLKTGWFVEPTVFADVHSGMRIAREEIFGPVISVLAYENDDEAIAIANDSAYGLSGSIFTGDVQRGLELAKRMRTGTVELNASPAGYGAPMGGVKMSGIGREFAQEGLDSYVEFKSVGVPPDLAEALART